MPLVKLVFLEKVEGLFPQLQRKSSSLEIKSCDCLAGDVYSVHNLLGRLSGSQSQRKKIISNPGRKTVSSLLG